MTAADWTFEDRLHERLDARALIRALPPRQRHIVIRTWLHGETLREIGKREGLSPARVAQVHIKALQRLQRPPQPPPRPEPAKATPPPGFDRAAFWRHMDLLIRLRDQRARQRFERERAVLARMLEGEQAEVATLPQPAKPWKPVAAPPFWAPPPPPPPQHVEPWFDPAHQPTLGDLRCIGEYAIGYFTAIWGSQQGSADYGGTLMRVQCPRTADAVAEGLQRVKAELPPMACLSACLLETPDDVLCATVGNRSVALRISSVEDGKQVAIELTYDPPHGST